MDQVIVFALAVRKFLESLHPSAPWLALSLCAWVVVYVWRKTLPGLWIKLEELDKPLSVAIGALPSVIMTTAVGALTAGTDPWTLVCAALMGVGAPLLHHLLKALPIPYQGQPAVRAPQGPKSLLLIVLWLQGCTVPLERARTAGINARQAGAIPTADDTYCRKIDSARTAWGGVAKGAAALAAGGGLSTIPVENRETQIGIATTAAVAAVVAGVAVYVSESKGASWARDCAGAR